MDVKSPIAVRHFQYTTWPKDDERPATSEGILQLISAVEKWQKTLPKPGPIVVLCMNAAGRTGAFCTIQRCLDQIREEQGANVLQNAKQLRISRTNMVDTPAKYFFCYETILEYLKAFDDYASKKKSFQNVADVNKDIPKPKEETKKEYDDGVIYDNQDILEENKKEKEKDQKQQSKLSDMPQEASNVPDKNGITDRVSTKESPSISKRATLPALSRNEASGGVSPSAPRKATLPAYGRKEATSKQSPSSKRKSTPLVTAKTKPLVLNKPKARPKTFHEKDRKPLVKDLDGGEADGAELKKSVKKNEQHYENVTFEADI